MITQIDQNSLIKKALQTSTYFIKDLDIKKIYEFINQLKETIINAFESKTTQENRLLLNKNQKETK